MFGFGLSLRERTARVRSAAILLIKKGDVMIPPTQEIKLVNELHCFSNIVFLTACGFERREVGTSSAPNLSNYLPTDDTTGLKTVNH